LIEGDWFRVTLFPNHGQTALSIPAIKATDAVEVRRNGILLHVSEYSIADGYVEIVDPASADEVFVVYYGAKLMPGVFKSVDAGGAI
jgi:hypothetical protein